MNDYEVLNNEIKQKQDELNLLRLQKESARFRLMLNTLSNKEKFQLAKDVENAFNIKFEIEKFLWLFKKVNFYVEDDTDGFWHLEITKYGIRYSAWGSYSNPRVKREIKTLIELSKKYVKGNYLGISGLNGIKVPEFIESGLQLIYV